MAFGSSEDWSSSSKDDRAWEISAFMEASEWQSSSVPYHCFKRQGILGQMRCYQINMTTFSRVGLSFSSSVGV